VRQWKATLSHQQRARPGGSRRRAAACLSTVRPRCRRSSSQPQLPATLTILRVGAGDHAGAAQRFTHALHLLGPRHACQQGGHHTLLAQLCSNRSAALAALGHHAGALLDALRAAHLAPGWGKAHLRKALALLQLGRAAAALQAARAGAEAEPGSEELASLVETAQARLLRLLRPLLLLR
jgi:hypothetical protein